jgi:CheY-like chemotaxis protein
MDHRFLLVEDNAELVRALVKLVEGEQRHAGVSLVMDVARTVKEGFEALHSHRKWTGFLIDVGLPDGNGLDVLGKARENGNHAPALIFTARNDRPTERRRFERDFSASATVDVGRNAAEHDVTHGKPGRECTNATPVFGRRTDDDLARASTVRPQQCLRT